MKILLAVIAITLFYAVAKWRSDVEDAKRNIQRKRQKCADAYNERLRTSYRNWFDEMTKEGHEPAFLAKSRIRDLTPDEIGVKDWEAPEQYWKMEPDWRSHPDCDALIAESYAHKRPAGGLRETSSN